MTPNFKLLTPQFLTENDYFEPRLIRGEECCLTHFVFTVGLIVGADELGYKYRYCFPDLLSAKSALNYMVKTQTLELPTSFDWIVRKGEGGDIRNNVKHDK